MRRTIRRILLLTVASLLLAIPAGAHETGVDILRCWAVNFNPTTWRGKCFTWGLEGKDVRLVLRVKARWDIVVNDTTYHQEAATRRNVRSCLCFPPPEKVRGGGALPMPHKPFLTDEEIAREAHSHPTAVLVRVIHAHERQ